MMASAGDEHLLLAIPGAGIVTMVTHVTPHIASAVDQGNLGAERLKSPYLLYHVKLGPSGEGTA